MKPYNNFYVRTLIRVLKNNKVYNNKTKSYLFIQFDKAFKRKINVFPTKLFTSYINCDITVKTYYNIITEYRRLIADRLIDDINLIVGNNLLTKDEKTIEQIIYRDITDLLYGKLQPLEMISFTLKSNEIFYRYDDINDNKK